jgi:hypothetical protein
MTEDQVWAIGVGLVALLLAVVVSLVIASRTRAASEAHAETRVRELQARLVQQDETRAQQANDLNRQLGDRIEAERVQRQQFQHELQGNSDQLRADVLQRLDERFGRQDQRLQEVIDALGRQLGQAEQGLQEVTARLQGLEHLKDDLQLARLQTTLTQAVATGFKARTHLNEQNSGLAEHDLTELDEDLQRALVLAPDGLKPRIEEVRRGVHELKESIEARTFPVAAVEMLTDRIRSIVTLDTGQ